MDSIWAHLISIIILIYSQQVVQARDGDYWQRCLSFEPEIYVRNSTRTLLSYVAANTTLDLSDNDITCARPSQLVSVGLCRIALSIPTSNRSSITFEAWLPDNWSGRFLATGNGGIDGCIKYEDLAYASLNGFAAVASNNGHNGTSGVAFYHNAEIVEDFAWRAMHTTVITGKKLVGKLYGRAHDKSYYLGCSLGGRQGVKSAIKFPGDFDGIVAGAPAVDFNNLVSWRASFFTITGAIGSINFIPASSWTGLIHTEILRQCDFIDGVADGIIEDPDLCHFKPEALLCAGNSSTGCLNPAQVDQLHRIFSPLKAEDGKLIYPAMQPGSEVMAVTKLYAGKPFSYSDDWFKYVVYDPTWNAASFTVHDAAVADALNPADIRTYPNSLKDYQYTGGKILIYHGGQDNQITSFNSERFYANLLKGMRTDADGLDEFFRFFRISGMFHCNSGPGAWVLGQGGGAAAAGIPFAPKNNVLAAMVNWVENGDAPENIEGTKFVNDSLLLGVALQRRHCRYPLRNTYLGGDSSLPSSWNCSRIT